MMGISSDGILVFGFNIGEPEESPLPELLGDGEDFEDFIADEAGVPPWRENGPDDYWEKKKAAVALCPVDLVTHCSYNYPMYILAIRGTEVSASRGHPEIIEFESLVVPQEKIDAARDWCNSHKIEWQEPKWILCSIYG